MAGQACFTTIRDAGEIYPGIVFDALMSAAGAGFDRCSRAVA